ncbi:FRIGIDA-like protein 5 [Cornus florida]|uniref:FRIGIDA-like protein 5 n=1 Tax=Cornus florida TaxID=4283 RepID=UPI0028A1B2E6|nr:FRIGIDA-like protein 5 [Cornus florida]
MASLEKLSASLELTKKKTNGLRKAILLFALEWKDFEKHLESNQQSLEESWCEIDSKEKHLELIRKSAIESNEEVELLRISARERFEELEVKENEFKLFQEEHITDFKLKEEKLGSFRKSVEERMEEVELREEKLGVQQKLVEGLFEKIELKHKQFEPIQRLMDERFKEINVKEKHFESLEERYKHFESRSKELHAIQNWIERRAKELDTKEECLEERCKELDLKEKEFVSLQKLTEERCKEIVKEKQLDSTKKLNEEWPGKLDSREKQFNSVKKFGPQCFMDFRSEKKQLKSEGKMLEGRSKELEEEKFANALHSSVEIEHPENVPPDNRIDCLYADIRLCMTMDGKSLQIFLNERSNRHDVMSDEICRALRLRLDSAKLVLDAMEGFYPPHLKKGDREFQGDVVRRSCILLLEQLMTISPWIRLNVKEEAFKLAHEWKVKMGTAAKNSLEVLGFLQLLPSYKLTSEFDADELWKLFEVVAEHKAAPKLCWVLDFADKIPDLIQNFINKKQHLVALRYICAFELVNKFPPVPLLREYLCCRKMPYKSHNVQNRAIEERVAAVISDIVGHKLEIKYSNSNLEECIEQLIMLKDGNLCNVQASEKKLTSSTTDPIPTKALNNASILPKITAPILPKITAPTLAPATTMAFILAKMNGKRLQIFLNEHLEEHELLCNEVSTALQMSVDSGKLVLDAMQGFYPPHLKKGKMYFEGCICRRSCMLLLEQLMRLSPQITPKVKEEAMQLAVDWKEKMRSETEKLVFFQMVGAYRLASAFDVDELSLLFGTVVHLRHAPELCQILGFSLSIPVGNVLHSHEEVDQSSSQNSLFSNKIISSSVGPQVEFKSVCTNMKRKQVSSSIQFSLDPAKLVLDALLGCYHSNLKGNMSPRENVLRTCAIFLEQLMRVSPKIKPHVQKEAMNFAVDWKAEMMKSKKPVKVLIFLQIVAIYKLVSWFNANELLRFLGSVNWHEQAIDLFPILELADKIPDIIKKLIEREQRLAAIEYIYAYGLVDKFPPVPLLKAHLTYSVEIANKICKEVNNSLEAQDRATKREVDALRAVIKCITDHGLESDFSPENLKTRIEQLERESADQRIVAPPPASESQPQEHAGKKIVTPTPAPSSEAQLQEEYGKKCINPASEATAQKKAGKKRIAPTLASKTQPEHQQAKKHHREARSKAAASYPVHSARPPSQPHYLWVPAEYCRPRGSTPYTSHLRNLNWQYGLGAMPFAPANFYAPPFAAPVTHHLYHPRRYPYPRPL